MTSEYYVKVIRAFIETLHISEPLTHMIQCRDIKLLWPVKDQLKSCDFNRSVSDLANFFVCHIMHTPTQIFFSFFFSGYADSFAFYFPRYPPRYPLIKHTRYSGGEGILFFQCGSFHQVGGVKGASHSSYLQLLPDMAVHEDSLGFMCPRFRNFCCHLITDVNVCLCCNQLVANLVLESQLYSGLKTAALTTPATLQNNDEAQPKAWIDFHLSIICCAASRKKGRYKRLWHMKPKVSA